MTSAGQVLLKRDPRAAVAAAVESMPIDQREALAIGMETLLHGLLAIQRFPEPDGADSGDAALEGEDLAT